uniref:Uncharacterized protein n=1 Tax=Arundo donax TaxID=35708 RepID=A0A0A9E8V2_ARUDO
MGRYFLYEIVADICLLTYRFSLLWFWPKKKTIGCNIFLSALKKFIKDCEVV